MRIRNTKGFVLIVSIIVLSVVLTVSLTISALVMSEIDFSILSRESQRAFYAANAGLECALYWDLQQDAFATTSSQSLPISCANLANSQISNASDTFSFSLTLDNNTCVNILVDKIDPALTVISSRGFNTCATNNPKRVERALRASY